MSKKYRKKPVVIEAMQYDGTLGSANEVFNFMSKTDTAVFSNGQYVNLIKRKETSDASNQ